MAILTVQTPYVDGGTVTSTNLNALVTDSSFTTNAVDGSTTQLSGGSIVVKDNGISTSKLSTSLQGVIEKTGTAYFGGDKTGNTRGNTALDIQSQRSAITQVAGGISSVAIGSNNTASGNYGVAIGRANTATGLSTVCIGLTNTSAKAG